MFRKSSAAVLKRCQSEQGTAMHVRHDVCYTVSRLKSSRVSVTVVHDTGISFLLPHEPNKKEKAPYDTINAMSSDVFCQKCGKRSGQGVEMRRCSGCKCVHYCGTSCRDEGKHNAIAPTNTQF